MELLSSGRADSSSPASWQDTAHGPLLQEAIASSECQVSREMLSVVVMFKQKLRVKRSQGEQECEESKGKHPRQKELQVQGLSGGAKATTCMCHHAWLKLQFLNKKIGIIPQITLVRIINENIHIYIYKYINK